MRDIAAASQVSVATVSLALQDHPRISQARREEIQATAIRLGYSADPMLNSLSAYRKRKRVTPIHATIVWINHWRTPEDLRRLREFDAYWKGAHATATQLGYRLEEVIWDEKISFLRLMTRLRDQGVQGILFPPHGWDPKDQRILMFPPEWETFDWSAFSLVRFGHSLPTPQAHVVTTDQHHASMTAVLRMKELGYRRIGYVSRLKFEAFLAHKYVAGFHAAQLAYFPSGEHIKPLLIDSGASEKWLPKLARWIERQKPDAILTPLDIKGSLEEAGYRIPRDFAMATTSVLDTGTDAGIDQNSWQVGCAAAQMLINMIHNKETGVPPLMRETSLHGTWVDGSSLPDRTKVLPGAAATGIVTG